MLHDSIQTDRSEIAGTGLLTTRTIREREPIWWESNPPPRRFVKLATIESWDARQMRTFLRHARQVGEELYEGSEDGLVRDAVLYMNHSCDPNTWYDGDHRIIARRPIEIGEEITIDYAMSECHPINLVVLHECLCGSKNCRGFVLHTDYKTIDELRERYQHHVMAHVMASLIGDDT